MEELFIKGVDDVVQKLSVNRMWILLRGLGQILPYLPVAHSHCIQLTCSKLSEFGHVHYLDLGVGEALAYDYNIDNHLLTSNQRVMNLDREQCIH